MNMLRASRIRPATAVVLWIGGISSAHAQTYDVAVTQGANIGEVTSGVSGGDTAFRISSAVSGGVSKAPGTGSGALLAPGSGRATVSIKCTGGACNSSTITMAVTASGSTSGRMNAPYGFTVSDGTADASGSGPWTISGIRNGQTRTIYLGMDVPIEDNSSGAATGAASAQFTVGVQRTGGGGGSDSAQGTVTGNVIRPLAVSKTSDLTFGKIIKGAGTVTINQDTGARSAPVGYYVASSTTSRAAFKVTGEANRQVSVSSIPNTVSMAGPQAMTITLMKGFGSTINLQQAQGGPSGSGEYTLGIGGQVNVPSTQKSGIYSGSFIVTLSYQ